MDQTWKQWQGRFVTDEFQLCEYLGGSQHSVVFLTERPGKNPQKAAIKLVPANSADAQAELLCWQSAASLSHPNLLRIFETGQCRLDDVELLYLVTEYAEENLSQILLQRPLTPQETREMLDPVLDALLYLHGKDFVHGGLKPSNIMAVADQLKISSDGVRRIGSSGALHLSDGHSPGSASPYASPEAPPAIVSSASDVWSLGMTLVEVLTQQVPTGNSADSQFPESVTQILPEPFRDIAGHALQRDPSERWSIGQIAARLQPNPLLHPAPVSVPLSPEPPSPRAKPRSPQSKFSSPRYLVPGVALGILAGMIFMSRFLGQQPHAAQSTGVESKPAQLAVPSAVPHAPRDNVNSAVRTTKSFAPAAKTNGAAHATVPAILRPEERNLRTSTVASGSGAVLHQVLPDVSAKARDTIHGTVKIGVRVRVNPVGRVTEADLAAQPPSKYFADLSLRAARQWTFRAPESNGRSLPSEWLIHFYFTSSATRALPEQTNR